MDLHEILPVVYFCRLVNKMHLILSSSPQFSWHAMFIFLIFSALFQVVNHIIDVAQAIAEAIHKVHFSTLFISLKQAKFQDLFFFFFFFQILTLDVRHLHRMLLK